VTGNEVELVAAGHATSGRAAAEAGTLKGLSAVRKLARVLPVSR
jgi:hypothetical protein